MTPTIGQSAFTHDVIVFGAGPAGASAALTAAQNGLRVALVDKHMFPRDKLCGGGLTGRAMKQYRAIFGSAVPDVPILNRETIHFCAFGDDLGANSDAPALHFIMRHAFDQRAMGESGVWVI